MPTKPPRLDILLATYNGAAYLPTQLDSLRAQSLTNWHIWARDDGSQDETVRILDQFALQFPDKLTRISDSYGNVGIKENFNLLQQHSTAPYIFFCDQDDRWSENKLAHCLDVLLQAEADFGPTTPLLVHTDLAVVDRELTPLASSFWQYQHLNPQCKTLNRLLVQNNITGCALLTNRTLLQLAYPVPPAAIMHDWWLGLTAAALGNIIFSPLATVHYRQHGGNDTGAKHWSVAYIVQKWRSPYDITPTRQQAEAFYARFHRKLTAAQQRILQAYITLPESSWLQKRLTLWRYGLLKQGLLRNLGFFWNL